MTREDSYAGLKDASVEGNKYASDASTNCIIFEK